MRTSIIDMIPLVIRRAWLVLGLLAALALVTTTPALAHKNHKKADAAQVVQPNARPGEAAMPAGVPAASTDHMGMMNDMGSTMGDMDMDRSKMLFLERLFGWLGRMHPMVVHFPIAFFPAALVTAIVGRRRPAFAAPVQFLVVAGGIGAPIAAVLGLIAGLDADPDTILAYHRALGVIVGLSGAALGIWAWKRPWEDRGAGMIVALTFMTIAIAVQGFLGGSITHGMDHMMF